MTVEEVCVVLADGGALYPPTNFVRDDDEEFKPVDPERSEGLTWALPEFSRLSQASQESVKTIVIQRRGWGFFGFDEFCLYFDRKDKLVAHVVQHFN